MKNVSVGIDHVAVSGLPAGPRGGEAIGRRIETALGRLIEQGGVPAGLRDAGALTLPALRLPPNATDGEIAEAVAAALHRALSPEKGTR